MNPFGHAPNRLPLSQRTRNQIFLLVVKTQILVWKQPTGWATKNIFYVGRWYFPVLWVIPNDFNMKTWLITVFVFSLLIYLRISSESSRIIWSFGRQSLVLDQEDLVSGSLRQWQSIRSMARGFHTRSGPAGRVKAAIRERCLEFLLRVWGLIFKLVERKLLHRHVAQSAWPLYMWNRFWEPIQIYVRICKNSLFIHNPENQFLS